MPPSVIVEPKTRRPLDKAWRGRDLPEPGVSGAVDGGGLLPRFKDPHSGAQGCSRNGLCETHRAAASPGD